ncbi:MAG: ABC transporter ATP-binding protein/permease [Clostridia bacterium]|nr:ABC transporter ATP-binding protein/permease [Clostridia bacterium]
MLEIKSVSKKYKTGDLVQQALNDVSLNLRDNEFVSILGPSGSGKTTLLNIIGGLDRYDSGDLVINGTSTKKYKDRDWDAYRNHTIGFVFQSYNLIPHQNILSNVELALTISGISKSERKRRAKAALEEVGLGDQVHKKPNQLSGGQMQRVAIARALVNEPDILLADEPTGALDTETSIQIMDLLKKVAEKRLVVMVTHNPELAEEYSTRIVKLRDGKIIDDSDPYTPEKSIAPFAKQGRAKMNFFTSLALSANNLRTKKGRTILTAFAGSIGIIGIALILSLSTGVNQYIEDIQKDTMTSYPVTISETTFDLAGMMESTGMSGQTMGGNAMKVDESLHEVHASYAELQAVDTISSSFTENNLTEFKHYLDNPDSEIHQYVGGNGIVYSYNVDFDVYSYDKDGNLVNSEADTQNVAPSDESSPFALVMQNGQNMMSIASMMGYTASSGASNFSEIMLDPSGKKVSPVVTDSYDLLYGTWPENYNDVVLVLNHKSAVNAGTLYQLGFITADEYLEMQDKINNGEEPEELTWDYADMIDHEFYLIPACDNYEKGEDGNFAYVNPESLDEEAFREKALPLNISGIIRVKDSAQNSSIQTAVAYTSALTDYIISHTDESEAVKAQKADEEKNILTGMNFEAASDEQKIEDAKAYIAEMGVTEKAQLFQLIQYYNMQKMQEKAANAPEETVSEEQTAPQGEAPDMAGVQEILAYMSAEEALAGGYITEEQYAYLQMTGAGAEMTADTMGANAAMMAQDEASLAAALDEWIVNTPDDEILISVYDQYIKGSSYDSNMEAFGYVSTEAPSSISIYTDSFEAKDGIADSIKNYNETVSEENKISYTDYVALLTSSITTIISAISYVLIAFVAVSLVVSCIMIGIITNISVLERTKEIGILRALGASKRNISQVFNAETIIIGLCSGLLGVLISWGLTFPINSIIQSLVGNSSMRAELPFVSGVILVVISIIITLIGGLIPAKKAARKDPVLALRSE